MKRYSIMVMEFDREIELCQCDDGADDLAKVLAKKTMGRARVQKYKSVRIVDHQKPETAA